MISKEDAAALVEQIKACNLASHAIAVRYRTNHYPAFVGGIEVALQHFLRAQGHADQASEIAHAFNRTPTNEEVAAYNEEFSSKRSAA